MKRFAPQTFTCRSIGLWCIPLFFAAATPLAADAPLKEARVSQVIQDVRLLEAHGAPRPAAVNDKVTLQRAVRTGKQSRAELTFTDLTITRLGANTIFSLKAGAREVDLTSGTILLSVPSGAAPAKANTVSVTVAVVGGTALLATGPPTKFMVLEGTGTIYPRGHPEKAVTVQGGEMVMVTEDGQMTQPEKFDVKLILETSPLLLDFPPLTNLPLILQVMNQQIAEQQLLGATTQPLARNLIDLIDVTDQSANSDPILLAIRTGTPTPTPPPPITPTPTPSKFGTPSTIISPNPYVITSGTVITTDPSITTNGVTDDGKIYRGAADDGAFTLWAFGSTSAFDTALGIDDVFFADANHLPIATFKFQSLSLTGNPTIDLSNGGGTKLALIGVDGITSGPPGGTLTFTGLDLLVLATVNGSINLTSDVSFQDLSELAMYARGTGSDLIIDSPISNIGILDLAAEGSIQLTNLGTMSVGEFDATAGNNLTLQVGSLLLDGKASFNTLVLPGTTVTSGANVTLNITGDYMNSSTTESSSLSVTNAGGNIGTGGNISVTTGGDFTSSGDATFTIQNTTGTINNGGNLTFTVGGSISTPGVFTFLVENYDGSGNIPGHIGTGGNISVTTGGDLSALSLFALINNRSGGQIDAPVSLTLSIGGALTTSGNTTDPFGFSDSLFVIISTRFDNTNGNPALASIVGGDATLTVNADSASIGGNLSTDISNSGSTLNGNALLSFGITHDVSIQGEAELEILNDADSATPLGGILHGSATLQFSSNNFTANTLFAQIDNRDGGVIDSNATLAFDLTGSLATPGTDTVSGDADIVISNQKRFVSDDSATSGGTIGGNALIQLSAASASTAGLLDVEIHNFSNGSGSTGGSIGGNATISLNIAGDLTTQGDAFFNIANQNNGGTSGGTIGSDATINVAVGSLTSGPDVNSIALTAQINNIGGSIGGLANLAFNLTGDLTATLGSAQFSIFNNNNGSGSGGGTIGTDATIDVNLGNLTSGPDINSNALVAQIDNRGGSIGGDATITFAATGNIDAQGNALFQIFNFDDGVSGSGSIGGSAILNVSAIDISTGGFLFDAIINSSGSTVGDAISSLSAASITASSLTEGIFNTGGSIGSSANLTCSLSGDLTTTLGSAEFDIINNNDGSGSGGGTIGTDATITVDVNNITSGPDINSNAWVVQIDNSGGNIGGNAVINFGALGNVDAQGNAFLQILNFNNVGSGGGAIGGDAILNVSAGGDITTDGIAIFQVRNDDNFSSGGGGSIVGDAMVNVSANNVTASSLGDAISNNGGTINGTASLGFTLTGDFTSVADASFTIGNYDDGNGSGPGTISGAATIDVTATSITPGGFFSAGVDNHSGGIISGDAAVNVTAANITCGGAFLTGNIANLLGGTINGNASVNFNLTGDLTTTVGNADFRIDNSDAGTIGAAATINVSAANISTADYLNLIIFNNDNGSGGGTIGSDALITVNTTNLSPGGSFDFFTMDNTGGSIAGNASINFNLTGNLTASGEPVFGISNPSGGTIGGNANVTFVAAGDLTSQTDASFGIDNANRNAISGGTIGGNATIDVTAGGLISTLGNAFFQISNDDAGSGAGGGTIVGDATIDVTAGDFSTGLSLFAQIFNNGGGSIGGSANLNFALTGDLTTQADANFQIVNQGGTIKSDAAITVTAATITTGSFLFSDIENTFGGSIGGNANLNFSLTGDLNTQGVGTDGQAIFEIFDFGDGAIGGDATINLNAANISTGDMLFNDIDDHSIGGSATINFSLTGDLTTQTDAQFQIADGTAGGTIGSDAAINVSAVNISSGGELFAGIFNTGGTIGGDATINVNAASIAANSLVAQIDNTDGIIGGSTEGGATINMNVSSTATVTSDATVAIYGSDGAIGGAAVNFNGGNYDAGGTFLAFIDQSGTITFNNATAHADVLKVGALGTNGVLNIGGGMLSADTTLELYASGSNGQLNFMSNVTLGGNSVKILAANSITIFDNIVVTIGGSLPAEVYTNNANYTGFGGNGTTTGTFDGAGANNPLPLDQAPPFGPAPRKLRGRDITSSRRTIDRTINVNSTSELLALLDGGVVGPDGRITFSNPRIDRNNLRDLSRMDANRLLRAEHQMAIQQMRDRGVTRVGGRLASAQ